MKYIMKNKMWVLPLSLSYTGHYFRNLRTEFSHCTNFQHDWTIYKFSITPHYHPTPYCHSGPYIPNLVFVPIFSTIRTFLIFQWRHQPPPRPTPSLSLVTFIFLIYIPKLVSVPILISIRTFWNFRLRHNHTLAPTSSFCAHVRLCSCCVRVVVQRKQNPSGTSRFSVLATVARYYPHPFATARWDRHFRTYHA